MNQFKFKAYCTDRNEWVNIIDLGLFHTGKVKEVAYTYDSEPYERKNSRRDGRIKLVQYTGLKDKNGTDIYDGDILSWKIFDGMAHFNGIDKVYLDNGAFRLNRHHSVIDYINNGDVEIIGNVHEHPELLRWVEHG